MWGVAAAAALPLSRAVPDADPRAGPAVSRQELPDSKQELGEWTDLAQGANGALSNFQCHFPRLPRHFKVKRDRRSPLCSAFISGKLRSSTTKDGPGCDSSTSPPLRGLRSTSRTLQKGIVTAAQSFTETRPPPNPTRSRHPWAPFGSRGPNSPIPPPSYPSIPSGYIVAFRASCGALNGQDSGVLVTTAQPEGCACFGAGCWWRLPGACLPEKSKRKTIAAANPQWSAPNSEKAASLNPGRLSPSRGDVPSTLERWVRHSRATAFQSSKTTSSSPFTSNFQNVSYCT